MVSYLHIFYVEIIFKSLILTIGLCYKHSTNTFLVVTSSNPSPPIFMKLFLMLTTVTSVASLAFTNISSPLVNTLGKIDLIQSMMMA